MPATRQVPSETSNGAEATNGRPGAFLFLETATYAFNAKLASIVRQCGCENNLTPTAP